MTCETAGSRHHSLLVAIALAFALSFALGIAPPAGAQQRAKENPAESTDIEISARRIDSYQRGLGGTKQFGRLEFRGGLVMTSSESRFGGFSGLILSGDGRNLLAISDQGHWLSGEITYSGKAPSGIAHARMATLLALNGRPLIRKRDADAEEIALLSGTLKRGVALVAFERNRRIAQHPIVDGALGRPTGLIALPDDVRRTKSNTGLEAVTVLRGGPFRGAIVAFAEDLRDANDHHTGWIMGRGAAKQLAFKDIGGFALTGAASMDDGSVLILERRFRFTEGVKMRLRLVAADELKPGQPIEGETLIASDMSHEIDNMEAVAVHKAPDGETVITLMSDDNYNRFLQRNLLLQFTLHPSGSKSTSR